MNKEKFNMWVKLGGLAVLALIIAPIVFSIIKGVIGVAIALGLVAILGSLTPAFSAWLTHLKFDALKFVIDRAPVEELIQRAKERWDAITEQSGLLHDQAATLALYKKKAVAFMRNFPDDAAETLQNLAQYEQLFAYRMEAFKDAKKETQLFMKTIDRAEAIYEMAVADAQLGKSFGKNKDFMAVFREKTAFDAIDRASAKSMATLQMAIIDNDYGSKIDAPAREITYDSNNNVVLGNILDTTELRIKALKD